MQFFHDLKFPKEINLIFLSVLLFATALGMNLVLFPAILNSYGVSASGIGIAFMAEAAGTIVMSFFLGKFVARFGVMKSIRFGGICYAVSIILIYFCSKLSLWISLAFFMGLCWFIYVITRQALLNIMLDNKTRGVAIGILSMTISFGLALGPVIARLSGATNYYSFLICGGIVLLSLFCLRHLHYQSEPDLESERISLKTFFRNNPRCLLTRFFLDFQTYLLMTFTVIFGKMIGLSYEAAGLLVTAYMVTGFFDIYVGFLLKKYSPYSFIKAGFAGCLACFLVIIFYNKSYQLLLLTYFCFGLSIACIYVSVFKIVNDDHEKEELVAANSTFQLIGSIGSICGSLAGAFFVKMFGAKGFPIAMVLCSSSYLVYLIYYDVKHAQK